MSEDVPLSDPKRASRLHRSAGSAEQPAAAQRDSCGRLMPTTGGHQTETDRSALIPDERLMTAGYGLSPECQPPEPTGHTHTAGPGRHLPTGWMYSDTAQHHAYSVHGRGFRQRLSNSSGCSPRRLILHLRTRARRGLVAQMQRSFCVRAGRIRGLASAARGAVIQVSADGKAVEPLAPRT